MNQPPEDWQRLASHVRDARKGAGYPTVRAFADGIGVSERTLGKLENGGRVGKGTLTTVARALGWPPDAPRRILAGGDPKPERLVAPAAEPEAPLADDEDEGALALEVVRLLIGQLPPGRARSRAEEVMQLPSPRLYSAREILALLRAVLEAPLLPRRQAEGDAAAFPERPHQVGLTGRSRPRLPGRADITGQYGAITGAPV